MNFNYFNFESCFVITLNTQIAYIYIELRIVYAEEFNHEYTARRLSTPGFLYSEFLSPKPGQRRYCYGRVVKEAKKKKKTKNDRNR